MSNLEDILNLDALSQAEMIRNKEIKSIELVEASIERIEKINPTLNAIVTPMFEEARKKAIGDVPVGTFSGVPFLIKDLLAMYKDVPLSFGTKILKNFIPDHDSELVIRYKKAGLIILGKTNTPELGILPTTEPHLFGPCRNPWDIEKTPGGSSGGSAAAVSARMTAMAHSNDAGGSIRIPASCCGLFGLKPTRARNPLGPDFGDIMGGIVAEHAVTLSVRDSAALLDATSGPAPGDPYMAPIPPRSFLSEAGSDPGKLRIAFSCKPYSDIKIHQDCIAALKDAVSLCESLGHEVEEAAPAINNEPMLRAFVVLYSAGCASTLKALSMKQEDVEPLTWALHELGLSYDAVDYIHAVQTIQRIARDVDTFFDKYHLWLTPTLAEPPVPLGSFDSTKDNPLYGFLRAGQFAAFTPICNITGQPAMSVPLFWNSRNLPIGVHFAARFGDEGTLFRLAAQLEKARPWRDKVPPIII